MTFSLADGPAMVLKEVLTIIMTARRLQTRFILTWASMMLMKTRRSTRLLRAKQSHTAIKRLLAGISPGTRRMNLVGYGPLASP